MSTHWCLSSSLLCWLMLSGVLFFSTIAATRRRTMFGCTASERDALLTYKSGIIDSTDRLTSWTIDQDCCRWSGVVCYNKTANSQVHVVQLNLQNPYYYYDKFASRHDILKMKGEMLSPSLLSLTHLEGLNLSRNDFGGVHIPDLVGSLQKLRYLDLGISNFSGKIPHQLGNLSNLRYLDLQSDSNLGSYADSLDWLLGLSYLTYLDMSHVNLSAVSQHWLPVMNTLPSLQELVLLNCNLSYAPSSLSFLNLTALNTLILSGNNFNSILPNWLWNLTTLSTLVFADLQIHGTIPAEIGNLTNLMHLELDHNSLSGPLPTEIWSLSRLELLALGRNYLLGGHIPKEIGNLSHLSILFLDHCSLSGTIPAEIGNLTSLEMLDLGRNSLTGSIPLEINKLSNLEEIYLWANSLEGVVSQLHFTNSTRLQVLSLGDNNLLNVAIDETWVPPFQLVVIELDSCKLGSSFPRWIRLQQTIQYLIFPNASIEDALPDWFWIFSSSTLKVVDLSQNKIRGVLPSSLESIVMLEALYLSGNLLKGSVPQLPPDMLDVDLSNNLLSGPLISLNFPRYLLLSTNSIVGSIPPSICLSKGLEAIDLSNNQMSGQIPRCNWKEAKIIYFIDWGNNKLTGEIPNSFGSLTSLMSLHLNSNNLRGRIPSSLQNCNRLLVLDLGDNELSGQIPTWIGQKWQELTILRLRSNKLYGNIPSQLGQLNNLQIIDLANNYLVGGIPHSFGNLSAIISMSTNMSDTTGIPKVYKPAKSITSDAVTLVIKGNEFSISVILSLFKSIDLSNNRLHGEIPEELGSLAGLQTLNLSRNYFTGKISNSISGLKSLETLDLSFNNLSGAIPQGLTVLSFLNHLNLSYNNLSGTIPLGNQLQTLEDGSIYIGNPYLCGAPTSKSKSCFPIKNYDMMDEVTSNVMLSYLPITVGFLVGVWSVFIIILFKKNWRWSYFGMIDKVYDRAYVVIKIVVKRRII